MLKCFNSCEFVYLNAAKLFKILYEILLEAYKSYSALLSTKDKQNPKQQSADKQQQHKFLNL